MTRTARAGDKGLDFATQPATYPKMYQDGARFWCRYSKGGGADASTFETNPGEIAAAVNAGGDFFANYERAFTTPEEGGAKGASEGSIDRVFWNDRGLQPGAGIIISYEPTKDPGANTATDKAVMAFYDNYQNKSGRPNGGYMPLSMLLRYRKLGLIHFTWLPMSSAVSGINTSGMTQAQYAAKMEQVARDNGINLCQNRNRWYGTGADEDIYINDDHIPFSHLQVKGALMTQPLTAAQTEAAVLSALGKWAIHPTISKPNADGSKVQYNAQQALANLVTMLWGNTLEPTHAAFAIAHKNDVTNSTAQVLAALKVVPTADVDETALANALVPLLVPALAAQLPQVSEGELETALRSIFRSVPLTNPQVNG